MRKFLILSFFLPLMAWAKSSLPACLETGVKHNCYGTITFPNGDMYVGEFQNDKPHGQGSGNFHNGGRYLGEHQDGKFHGQGTYTFADLLDNGTFTVGGLGVLVADTELNQTNIKLVGLAQTGLEYVPLSG